MSYKVLIIDDEPLARSIVKECMEQHPQLQLMEECSNGFEGVKAIQQHQPDLIFLDIQMPKITGFDKAISKWMELNKAEAKIPTEHLLKEAAKHPMQNERVVVKTGTKIKIIPVHEIHYLEAADDYVKIYTAEGSFLKKQTMGYFEEVLSTSLFVRTHRSYMVNMQQITRIDPYEKENHVAVLRSGVKIPVSRAGYPKLKAVLGL